jgi:hypothetical protein
MFKKLFSKKTNKQETKHGHEFLMKSIQMIKTSTKKIDCTCVVEIRC